MYEHFVGRRVVYTAPGKKYGYRGTISGVLTEILGKPIKLTVSFDNGELCLRSGKKEEFSFQPTSIEGCSANSTSKKYLRLLEVTKVSTLGSYVAVPDIEYPNDITQKFNKENNMDSTINNNTPKTVITDLLSFKPCKFALVVDAKGNAVYRFKGGKKAVKRATELAANLAAEAKDRRGIFYVMQVVSAQQVEQRPIVETTFDV